MTFLVQIQRYADVHQFLNDQRHKEDFVVRDQNIVCTSSCEAEGGEGLGMQRRRT